MSIDVLMNENTEQLKSPFEYDDAIKFLKAVQEHFSAFNRT